MRKKPDIDLVKAHGVSIGSLLYNVIDAWTFGCLLFRPVRSIPTSLVPGTSLLIDEYDSI